MAVELAHAVQTMLWTETSHAASVGEDADREDVDMTPPEANADQTSRRTRFGQSR
jgi:hypothetical protein